MKRMTLAAFGLLLIFAFTACSNDAKENKEPKADKELKISEAEKIADDKVVANINSVEITGVDYNPVYVETKMKMYQLGQDIEDTETVQDLAMDELVARELLIQEAEKEGVNITDEELESEFAAFKEENKDQFADYLKQFHLTEESFKKQLKTSLILEEYMKSNIKVPKVTDKEVRTAYDDLKEQNKDIPKFAELEKEIKEQLTLYKKQEKLLEKVKELKKSAKIEKKI